MDDYQITEVEFTPEAPFPFCTDALRKISWTYISWLMVALFISFFVYLLWSNYPLSSILPSVSIYFVIAAVHVLFRLRVSGRMTILSPDMLFLLLYTIFHLGYVTLFGLRLVPYAGNIFFFESSVPKALFIINIGLIGFLFGYEVMGNRVDKPKIASQLRIPRANWSLFGLSCMIIAIVTHLSVICYLGLDFFHKYGYEAVQDIEAYTGSGMLALFWRHSADLMIFGMLIYIISSALRHGKLFESKLAMIITIAFFALNILEGFRSPLMQLGVPLLLVRHYFVKPIKISTVAALFAATLFLFTAMAIVRTIVFEPGKMIEEFTYQKGSRNVTWMSPFIEAGGSFQVVDITAHEVPEVEPYWLGASWRDSITHIVPFLQGFLTRHGWARWGPSDWVTITYFGFHSSGKGFTVAAEGFLNFGYPGVFIELMFAGFFTRWLTVKFSQRASAMWALIMFGCLAGLVILVRNQLNVTLYFWAQVMVIAAVLNMLFGNEEEPAYQMEDVYQSDPDMAPQS